MGCKLVADLAERIGETVCDILCHGNEVCETESAALYACFVQERSSFCGVCRGGIYIAACLAEIGAGCGVKHAGGDETGGCDIILSDCIDDRLSVKCCGQCLTDLCVLQNIVFGVEVVCIGGEKLVCCDGGGILRECCLVKAAEIEGLACIELVSLELLFRCFGGILFVNLFVFVVAYETEGDYTPVKLVFFVVTVIILVSFEGELHAFFKTLNSERTVTYHDRGVLVPILFTGVIGVVFDGTGDYIFAERRERNA